MQYEQLNSKYIYVLHVIRLINWLRLLSVNEFVATQTAAISFSFLNIHLHRTKYFSSARILWPARFGRDSRSRATIRGQISHQNAIYDFVEMIIERFTSLYLCDSSASIILCNDSHTQFSSSPCYSQTPTIQGTYKNKEEKQVIFIIWNEIPFSL